MMNKYLLYCISMLTIGNYVFSMDFNYSNTFLHNRRSQSPSQESSIPLCQLPIFEAIDNNNLEKVKEIIEGDLSQLEVRNHYSTPLLWAVADNRIEIVRYLITKGADLHAYTDAKSPVMHLVKSIEMLRILAEPGANINALDSEGKNALDKKWLLSSIFVEINHSEIADSEFILELIKYGARFHDATKQVDTLKVKKLLYQVLLVAFKSNNSASVRYLLEFCKKYHIDLCFKDVNGNTLLHHLIDSEPKKDCNAKVRLLLEYFPKLANMQTENGNTPLHCAIDANDNALASLLIRYGVDASIPNELNFTACNLAINDGRFLAVLFRYGSVEDIFKNRGMKTPESTITKIQYNIDGMECVKADVTVENKDGNFSWGFAPATIKNDSMQDRLIIPFSEENQFTIDDTIGVKSGVADGTILLDMNLM